MKNRIIKIFIIIIEIVILYLFLNFNIGCIFKKIFGFCCPSCGLTRAFISILNLNFIDAFKYNIISIPLFIFIIIFNILLLYDIIFDKNKSYKLMEKVFRYYIIIIILLVITMIINNVNKI